MCVIIRVIYVSMKKRLSFRINVLSFLSVVVDILACFSLLKIQRKMLVWWLIHLRMNWHYYRYWISRLSYFTFFLQLITSFIGKYHFGPLFFQPKNLHTWNLSYARYSLLGVFFPKKRIQKSQLFSKSQVTSPKQSKNGTLEVWLHPFFSTILVFIFQNFQTFSWNHFQVVYPCNLAVKIKQTLLFPPVHGFYSFGFLLGYDHWSQLALNYFQVTRL